MGSSWVLLCAIALRLVLRGAALEDQPYAIHRQLEQQPFQDQRPVGQRPITFFPKKARQRPIIPSFEPKRRGIFSSETVIPRQSWDPPYRHRWQYLSDGKYKRMTAAVKSAESWFFICIRQNQTSQNDTVLCCATQAWELSVNLFCEADSRVKGLPYECCRLKGRFRLKCFDADSPNPSYKLTKKRPVFSNLRLKAKVNFDPSNCPRKNNKTSFTSQKIDMKFPLGHPTADNIESLCRTWRQRPFYSVKCLQLSDYEFAARQAKSINSLEKEFRQCCTTSDHKLNCASQKWREEVEKFCLVEKKHTSFECCSGDDPSVWSACFKSMSPDPHYNTSAHEAPSFGELCENTTTLLNRLPTDFPIETFLGECCYLSELLKTICSMEFREHPSPDVRLCCSLMHEAAEAANPRKKKRKICPILYKAYRPYGIPRALSAHQPFQDQRPVEQRPIFPGDLFSLSRPMLEPFGPIGLGYTGIFSSGVMFPRGRMYPLFFHIKLHIGSFPLGVPSANNIEAICAHGRYRRRLPKLSTFGGQYWHMAAAVNNAESWFEICCSLNQTSQNDTVLCCATQAWELSVKLFCEVESRVKYGVFECCRKRGSDRLMCFNANSPNPNYKPTEELPVLSNPPDSEFNFDPSNCPRKLMTPRSTGTNFYIKFPLGQPTADNIESLCRTWEQRPFYSSKCFKRSGYEFAARQAKSINSLEKEFRQCCTTSDHKLNCASQKWREEVEKFCLVEKKHTSFECCSGIDPFVWSACFKSMSPDPHYNTSAHEAPSFSELCENTTTLLNRIPTESHLRTFLSECCTVPVPVKTISITKFSEMSQDACLIGEPPSPDVKLCCRLMHEVAEETNSRQKRKICPIPSKPPMSLTFV